MNTRCSDIIGLDRLVSFKSENFRENVRNMVVHLWFSSFKAHNSIRERERYHYPLRRIFEVTKYEYNKLVDSIIRTISIKENNDTMGPTKLVP